MRQPAISPSYSKLAGSVTPTNPDDTRIECKIMDASEPESHHGPFFKLLEISTCFYEKKQLSASDISQRTGIDESEVRRSSITGIRLSLSARVQVINTG